MNSTLYFRRKLLHRVVAACSVGAALLGLSVLALVLGSLVAEGISGLNLAAIDHLGFINNAHTETG